MWSSKVKMILLDTVHLSNTRAISKPFKPNNVPLAVADHLSPLFRDTFPDSKIAKGYAATRTKTTCILNGSIAPYFKATLVDVMKSQPFSIAIDGSNDSGLEKMNHLIVQFFDEQCGLVVTQL